MLLLCTRSVILAKEKKESPEKEMIFRRHFQKLAVSKVHLTWCCMSVSKAATVKVIKTILFLLAHAADPYTDVKRLLL